MLKYNDRELQNIGNNVASLWGARVESWTVNNYDETVTFHCNEFGERFDTELSFDDLAEYDY